MTILTPALVLAGLGFVLGLLIFVVSKYFHVEEDPSIDEVFDMLPKYNCGACGFPGCREMAIGLIAGENKTSQCKPLKKEEADKIDRKLKEILASHK